MKFCPFCGFGLDGSEKFCRDCGKELPKSEVPSVTASRPEYVPEKQAAPQSTTQPKVASPKRDAFLSAILPMPLCVISSVAIAVKLLMELSYFYGGFEDKSMILVFGLVVAVLAVFLIPTSLVYGLVSVLTAEKPKLRLWISVALAVVFTFGGYVLSRFVAIRVDVPMKIFYVIATMYQCILIAFMMLQGALAVFGCGRELAKATKLQVIVALAYTILCFSLTSFLARFMNTSEEVVFASLAVAAFFAFAASVVTALTSKSQAK